MKIKLIALLAIVFVSLELAAQVDLPRPSAACELTQKVGVTDITVKYSRPQVILFGDDRTGRIYGDLLWYGFRNIRGSDIPWRAGANENTTITFSSDVKIEGQPLKAGTYGFHIALSEDGNDTLIFSKKSDLWGSLGYSSDDDALRVKIKSVEAPFENILTFDFEEIDRYYAVLALHWEKKKFPFKIEIETDKEVVKLYREHLKNSNNLNDYIQAASYCANLNLNHDEAINWAEKVIETGDENEVLKAKIIKGGLLVKSERKDEGIALLDTQAKKINNAQLNALAYGLLQMGLKEKAVEYFELNAKNHPDDANVHDSLGEGYMAINKNKKAIKSFEKSLALNPAENVKQNSLAQLEKLGVDISKYK